MLISSRALGPVLEELLELELRLESERDFSECRREMGEGRDFSSATLLGRLYAVRRSVLDISGEGKMILG
jgi:hypothetical protein